MKIIFLHGLGQTGESWKDVILALNIDAEVFSPNLFDLCKNEKTFHEMYIGLENFLKRFHEPIVLCGLSLGGTLALKYAIHHNEKVCGLIVIGARVEFSRFLIFLQNIIFRLLPEKIFQKNGITKVEVIAFCNSLMNLRFVEDLVKIYCPVGVFIGERDFINQKDSLQISQKITHSQFVVIKNSSHEVNIENPVLLAREVEKFMQTMCK